MQYGGNPYSTGNRYSNAVYQNQPQRQQQNNNGLGGILQQGLNGYRMSGMFGGGGQRAPMFTGQQGAGWSGNTFTPAATGGAGAAGAAGGFAAIPGGAGYGSAAGGAAYGAGVAPVAGGLTNASVTGAGASGAAGAGGMAALGGLAGIGLFGYLGYLAGSSHGRQWEAESRTPARQDTEDFLKRYPGSLTTEGLPEGTVFAPGRTPYDGMGAFRYDEGNRRYQHMDTGQSWEEYMAMKDAQDQMEDKGE